MAQINLSSKKVRHYRYVLGAFAIFSIVLFLLSSPSQVSSNSDIQDSKSSSSSSSEQAIKVGGSGSQFTEDTKTNNKQESDSNTSPQFADDSKKSNENTNNGQAQDPKSVDKDTPIKEAPKPQGSSSLNTGSGSNKGSFEAIKDSNKIYQGVPENNSNSNEEDPLDNAINGKTSSSSSSAKQVSVADCKKDPEYVVMVDAGSTGSRVHIYEFDVCYSPPKLNNEVFDMLKPGLSSFDTDVSGAAKSLDPLLDLALKTVPADKRGCTPIAVKATAGLRLLGEEKSKNILKGVRDHLEKDYPFAVVDGDGVSIMSGDDEGVYAWITANYLLGNIGSSEKYPTAAVFDLGGGSTQIVFEPDFKNGEKMIDGEHKYEINFGDRDFTLYQFSHLGYGLMAGRNKINGLIVSNAIKEGKLPKGGSSQKIVLESPCIPPGQSVQDVEVTLDNKDEYTVDLKGAEVASGAQCRFLAESILQKDAECSKPPCSFNGVHQPSLVRTFKETSDLFIFSYFYDRTNPLGMPSSFTLQELSELAKIVCNGETLWTQAFSYIEDSIKNLKEEPQWCLDLSFQVALLHTGYDIPLHRELRTAKKIANNELGWCLGASLPLLDKKSGWKCRVKEVSP